MGWEADLCSSAAVVACAPLAAFKDDERQVRSEADLRVARCLGRCCCPKLSSLNPPMDRDQDGDAGNSARRRAYPPVGVSRRIRVPEHNLVEIDRLGLRAPVTVYAEARLCVNERRGVAADAVVTIGHGSLVAAAK